MTTRRAPVKRLLHAAALASATLAIALIALGQVARAHAGELAQSAGEQLLRYARATHVDATRTLFLNGAALGFSSGSARDSVNTLLDTFELRCAGVSGGFGAQLAELLRKRSRPRAPATSRFAPVLRGGDATSAYLACLDFGRETLDVRRLLARLRAFARSGDLTQLADLRFVWARRDGAYTGYVALWNEGALPLRRMFPAQHDAAGIDVPGLPRPEEARRVLSAWQADAAPLITSYATAASAAQLARSYRAQLDRTGTRVDAVAADVRDRTRTWLLQRGSRRVLAVIAERKGGGSLIGFAPLD